MGSSRLFELLAATILRSQFASNGWVRQTSKKRAARNNYFLFFLVGREAPPLKAKRRRWRNQSGPLSHRRPPLQITPPQQQPFNPGTLLNDQQHYIIYILIYTAQRAPQNILYTYNKVHTIYIQIRRKVRYGHTYIVFLLINGPFYFQFFCIFSTPQMLNVQF